MTAADHEELLKRLQTVKALVMLTGYGCELYRKYLKGWRRFDFPKTCSISVERPVRIESVWLNYDENGRKLIGGAK
jgi:DNA adenine methylase